MDLQHNPENSAPAAAIRIPITIPHNCSAI